MPVIDPGVDRDKAVPMPMHLGMDAVLGLVLIASPWLFGFADAIWWPHVLVGLLESERPR